MKKNLLDTDVNDENLLKKSQQITKALHHKKINKILFSKEHLDFVIGFRSGETLTFKNYLCPLCKEWCNYDANEIIKMYQEKLINVTIEKVCFRNITFVQENITTLSCDFYQLNRSHPLEICGFLGPVILRPLHKTKKFF